MNAPLTRAAEGLDRWAFTVAEVERMVEAGIIPPDTRLEVIGGEIVPMSPKGARHEAAISRHRFTAQRSGCSRAKRRPTSPLRSTI